MKKVSCIIMGLVIILTSAAVFAGCSGESEPTPAGTYYSVSVDGGSGAGKYLEGYICTVKAEVPEGKQFMVWLKNGQEVSVNEEYSFNVTENSRLIAVFGDAVTKPDGVCYVGTTNGIGNGSYVKGSKCTVKIPESEMDRDFKGWAPVVDGVAGEVVSTDKTYTFTVESDIMLEALYNDVRLPMPDNSDNKMFNLIARNPVIEYDRQADPVTGATYTAFVTGVDYVRVYVYTSPEDDAEPITWFKIVSRPDGSGYLSNQDGTRTMNMNGTPGNYYTPDGNTHNMLKDIISRDGTSDGSEGDYSTEITYYFATQAIAVTDSVDGLKYLDSDISGKGWGVLNM